MCTAYACSTCTMHIVPVDGSKRNAEVKGGNVESGLNGWKQSACMQRRALDVIPLNLRHKADSSNSQQQQQPQLVAASISHKLQRLQCGITRDPEDSNTSEQQQQQQRVNNDIKSTKQTLKI